MTIQEVNSHDTIFAFTRSSNTYYERTSQAIETSTDGKLFKVCPVMFVDGNWARSQLAPSFFAKGTRVVYVVD